VSRALFLLIGLELRGWGRRGVRSLRTVRGAMLVGLGLLFFIPWLGSLIFMQQHEISEDHTAMIRRFFPLMLLAYCCTSLALSRGEGGLNFTQAEVCFLFPGPFSRRELLAYKIGKNVAFSAPSTFILALVLSQHAHWLLAAFVGLFLSLFLLQHFLMALYLIAQTVGLKAYSVARKAVVAITLLVLLGAVGHTLFSARPGNWTEVALALDQSPVWQVIRIPLLWFADTFLAQTWGELAVNGGLALAVNLGIVLLIFLLDAKYLEAAAARSERVHAQLQRLRRGEAITFRWGSESSKPSFGLRPFPILGGIGPIAWRQTLTATRSLGRLALLVFVLAPIMIGPILTVMNTDASSSTVVTIYGGMILWMSVILSTMLPFDFRGDLDRMEVLKSLPIPGWRIVIGQLCVPIFLLTLVQWLLIAALQLTLQPEGWTLGAIALFVLPCNTLVLALDNVLFLVFPGRLVVTPGDFESMGRNVLFLIVKLATLSATAGLAATLGAVVFFVVGEVWPLILLAAWLGAITPALLLLPVAAWAFARFDVARDVPIE